VRVLHLIHSHTLSHSEGQDIYLVQKGFSDYARFFSLIKSSRPDILHVHCAGNETFGIYAGIARIFGVRIVRTLYSPILFSYWYIVKQLSARFFYAYTMCTSRYDMDYVDQYHLSAKAKRSLVYQGVDTVSFEQIPKKDTARNHIYKKLGIAFTKSIRIIGTVVKAGEGDGVEHLIDAAYLADTYKNLTNTIFVILYEGRAKPDVQKQIDDLHVHGICFVIDDLEDAVQHIPAFDILVSPRTTPGDLYTLLAAMYMHVPCIATRVGDAHEFDQYIAAPLVPMQSAKFLTEAIMYVIQHENPATYRLRHKHAILPKKYTEEHEFSAIKEIYYKVIRKTKHLTIS
jgi:glycosyltransferase involved in cell wall biosynthesis